jgi:hypothetical protein
MATTTSVSPSILNHTTTPASSSSTTRIRDVRWREHTLEREMNKASTNTHVMSYYLEHCHKSKPKRVPGFKKPHETPELILSPLAQHIFPKYPLPLNFLQLQHHKILQRPPNASRTSSAVTNTTRINVYPATMEPPSQDDEDVKQ